MATFYERVKAHTRTLRFRLTVWNAAAGLLTGLAILIAVREGVRYALLYDVDQVLREDLREIELYFVGNASPDWMGLQEEMNRKAHGHDFHGWFVQFYDAAGKPTWSSFNTPPLPALKPPAKSPRTIDVEQFRLCYQALPSVMPETHSAVVGVNRRFLQREMASLDRMLLIVGAVVLLIVPAGGYLLAGRTTGILANLIDRTASLRPAALQERLPIRGTGDELDALASTINGLLDRLAAYVQQKHDFLANAAHELRTPLAAIRSSVEVSLNSDRTAEEYQSLLDQVIEECSSLQTLVNQLLLLAESEGEGVQAKHAVVSLDRIVTRSVEMFRGVAEEKGIEIVLESASPVSVLGNGDHLRQLLNNLLDNAIKFTAARYADKRSESEGGKREGGRIVVRLVSDEVAQRCWLTIGDNGIGIAEADQSRLFERFFRSDRVRSRESAVGGTGLGLAICRAIVSAHRGAIQVVSRVDEGTTVEVKLPTCSPEKMAADRERTGSRQVAGSVAVLPRNEA